MRIGIDVGGTHTDAVLMDGSAVVAVAKRHTTADVSTGIRGALDDLQRQRPFLTADVDAVMVGTTHFLNALVEADRLARTAAIRLCLPATAALPPFTEWPQHLRDALHASGHLLAGGHEFTGRRISRLDVAGLRRIGERLGQAGVQSIAVSSVFSPVNAEFEEEAADVLGQVLPDVPVSLSYRIGRIGLLERENATIINASLRLLAEEVAAALHGVVRACGITAPLFLSQNDGTVMDVETVQEYPVSTFASGPANSMRGAAMLSGVRDCAVVDFGGTTSDVGMLRAGFPREATSAVEVAGVPTNFRMPDVISIAIGGGSLVRPGPPVRVGPGSVGYRLSRRGLVFGGDVLTATDVAVAAGRADIGDRSLVRHLDEQLVHDALRDMASRHADAVNSMRTAPGEFPVVGVGGGSALLPERLEGVGPVVRPEHYAVANAVGAAIAQVSGEVDRIFTIPPGRRRQTMDEARQEAVDRAVAAGAAPSSVAIIDEDDIPIPYLPGEATRIRVKAVGDLRIARTRAPEGAIP
ncbi:hydantoinase/oxoprolinase N-terminal domain-containing protein [Sediminivirga luteola]|uniref:Hydantoinase n=1 Tax=Sediminivirga luteola TaxID=1774748 RepID=A0A8J2TZU4_9MICO|nr:hydantoinase/oxoprolinase family protein [Sediminivirga luteola]GGA21731.1 hydantoinase [Sediminivirga luteola]